MQMRWAGEMAITPVRREPSGDAPGRPPAPRLRTLQTHVVRRHLGRVHPPDPHRPRSFILHWDCDYWDVVVRMPVPNTSIYCSSQSIEEASSQDCPLYCPLQTGSFMDLPNVEAGHPVVPSSPIS